MRESILFISRELVVLKGKLLEGYKDIVFTDNLFDSLLDIKRKGNYEICLYSRVETSSAKECGERVLEILNSQGLRILNEIKYINSQSLQTQLACYLGDDVDKNNTFVISASKTDLEIADNLSINSIRYSCEKDFLTSLFSSDSWKSIAEFLVGNRDFKGRKAIIERNTRETKIKLSIDLDGSGKGEIKTKIPFFDHMLEQIVRHSGLNLNLECDGDLDIDEHHSVEDIAIVLGESIKKALGDKRGISRYGFNILTMDEVQAKCALDFSSRPYFIWNVDFKREYIGTFPTELFEHFFKSFSDAAACNLHIEVTEGNSHHMAEAIFKCFAKAVKEGVYKYPYSNQLPSTKGML